MKAIMTICAVCALLAGCDIPSSNGRYQIAASGSGWMYRVDTQTGKVWQCSYDGCKELGPEPVSQ